jgi:hypothetical protein
MALLLKTKIQAFPKNYFVLFFRFCFPFSKIFCLFFRMGTILYTSSVLMTFCNSSAYNVPSRISRGRLWLRIRGSGFEDIQSPSTAGSLNRTYKSTQRLLEVSVLRMAPSDTDSVSSCVTCGKKTVIHGTVTRQSQVKHASSWSWG